MNKFFLLISMVCLLSALAGCSADPGTRVVQGAIGGAVIGSLLTGGRQRAHPQRLGRRCDWRPDRRSDRTPAAAATGGTAALLRILLLKIN